MNGSLRYYLSLFLRRLPLFLLVATVISGIGITLAVVLPPTYASEAQVTVESSQIPDKLAGPTVSTPAIEQLQIFQQRLMTRPNLLAIANKLKVLKNQSAMSADQIVKEMTTRTKISSVSGRDQATLMTIGFEGRTPQLAAGVVNEYLTLMLQDDAKVRTDQAGQTLDFFNQEVVRLNTALDAQNQKVLAFKKANADALPENLQFMRSQQAVLQDRLAQSDRDEATLAEQRDRLIQIFSTSGHLKAAGDLRSPDQKQLDALQSQLTEALAIYSPQNPKVKMLQARIGQLQKAVDTQSAAQPAAAATAGAAMPDAPVAPAAATGSDAAAGGAGQDDPGAASPPVAGVAALTGNDVETAPPSSLLDLQLADINSRLASLKAQREDIRHQLEVLADAIHRTPTNALTLDGLQRDYDNIQAQYNAAVANQAQASTGERIASLSRGERITVIEQPAVPSDPVKPRRVLIAGGGVGGGIAAGLALIVLLELINSTIRRPADLVKKLGVTPIATIPYLHTRRELLRRRSLKLLMIMLVLAVVPVGLLAINAYYLPLDLIGQRLMDNFGIRG